MIFTLLVGAFIVWALYDWITCLPYPPFKWPLLFDIPSSLKNYSRFHDYVAECFERYNTRTTLIRLPPYRLFVTKDRANVEHILKTKWQDYHAGTGLRGDCLKDILGRGIFLADGEEWTEQRKTASKEFSANKFRTFMSVAFVDYAARLCDIVANHAKSGKPIDIAAYFFKLTLDAFGYVAFGVDLGGLKGVPQPFAAAFDNAQERGVQRALQSHKVIWMTMRALGIGSEKRMKGWMTDCNTFIAGLIEQRRAKSKTDLGRDVDLLSRLMDVTDGDNKRDDAYLRDMCINFMVAGRDTTACGLSWLFYRLATTPDAEKRLLEEIENILGDATPNFDNIKDCHYLQACMSETQRLHPSVPMDPKTAMCDDTLPSGHKVKKGDSVLYMNYSMGRDTEYWGPDAKEFRPSRWLSAEDGTYQRVDPFLFPAFQAGPRLCLGIDMAHLEMKIATVMLLQRFTFKLVPRTTPVTYRLTLVLPIKGGLEMTVETRKKA